MAVNDLVALAGAFGAPLAVTIWVGFHLFTAMTRGESKPDPGKALTEELRGLRTDIADVKDDIGAIRERLVRVETKLEAKPTRAR